MVKVELLKMDSNATSFSNSDEGERFEYTAIKLDENLVLILGTDYSDYKSYLYFNIYRKEKVNFQLMDTDTWMHKPSLNDMTNDTL